MKIYSVSELTHAIKNLLEENYPEIWVSGEVSNFKAHHNGHFYFNLKDEQSRLSAVMFHGSNQRLRFEPEDGMEVVCCGRLTVYPPYGNYQIVVEGMEPQGLGALQRAFEQLKEKLAKEGLFDEARKQSLPLLPRRIGVVTSISGAAIRDILNVTTRRYPNVEILIVPTAVQGDEAAPQIAAAVRRLNQEKDVDVIIVGRGGGSIEDLWAFNEEIVARAIFASKIPVISAVGHETDFTICDFVADVRAPTPSAAAELAVPSKEELVYNVAQLRYRLHRAMNQQLGQWDDDIIQLRKRLKDPRRRLEEMIQRLDEWTMRAQRALWHSVRVCRMDWERLHVSLKNLNPLAILGRGYCVAMPEDSNKPITSSEQVELGDKLRVRLAQGGLLTEVRSKRG
jgi:exodeoxyribonuclease VII large subunit